MLVMAGCVSGMQSGAQSPRAKLANADARCCIVRKLDLLRWHAQLWNGNYLGAT